MFCCCKTVSARSFLKNLPLRHPENVSDLFHGSLSSKSAVAPLLNRSWSHVGFRAMNTYRAEVSNRMLRINSRPVHMYPSSVLVKTGYQRTILGTSQNTLKYDVPRCDNHIMGKARRYSVGGMHSHRSILCYQYFFLGRDSQRFTHTQQGRPTMHSDQMSKRHKTVALYIMALIVFVAGGSYAAVPLYRLYCQASGLGGTTKKVDIGDEIESMERKTERNLTVRFNADTSATMRWNFRPQQSEIKIVPGETALAFYTAQNPTDKAITGISTYNVIPFDAGQYFNKIQCFCFEEQRLNPHEQVDMPVFFYIDPEFTEDPAMAKVDIITLSYTFFEAKDGQSLPFNLR